LESLQDSVADSSAANGADHFALEVESVSGDLGNIPVVGNDLLVRGDLVTDQGQDGHDDMFGNADDVGSGHFCDGDLVLVGRVQIDVVTSDSGSDTELEVWSLFDQVRREVARVERGGNEDLGLGSATHAVGQRIRGCTHVGEVLLKVAVGSFLVI